MSSKIEPRLEEEIRRIRESSSIGAAIPVVLQLAPLRVAHGGIAELEQQVRMAQAPLLDWLAKQGVSGATPSTLANAITAALTVEQIEAVAARPEIYRVVWNRPEAVTTA